MVSTALILRTACPLIGCVAVSVSNGLGAPRSLGSPQLSSRSCDLLADTWPKQTTSQQIRRYTPSKNGLAMYLKKGVSIRGLQPEIIPALLILSDITNGDFTITGGTEPAPGRIPTSLHPKGLAIDVRLPAPEMQSLHHPQSFKQLVSNALEDTEYDVVFYDSHVHIEFDPK